MRRKGEFHQAVGCLRFTPLNVSQRFQSLARSLSQCHLEDSEGWRSHSSLVGVPEHGVFTISCRLLMFLVKDNEFLKLFTILERRRTMREREVPHSDPQSKMQGQGPGWWWWRLNTRWRRIGECMGRWSKCGVSIEMVLVVQWVHANLKNFISEIVEKWQYYIT